MKKKNLPLAPKSMYSCTHTHTQKNLYHEYLVNFTARRFSCSLYAINYRTILITKKINFTTSAVTTRAFCRAIFLNK